MLDFSRIAPDEPRLLRRDEYEHLVQLGFFTDERVELLRGFVLQMSPHGPAHDSTVHRLMYALVLGLGPRARVRVQSSFAATGDSEPEPDIAVVPPGNYDTAHPESAWLVVEVAQTSLAKDRGPKADLYADAGVEEYWVVDLKSRTVIVHRGPRDGRYASVTIHDHDAVIVPGRFVDLSIRVSEILPQPT